MKAGMGKAGMGGEMEQGEGIGGGEKRRGGGAQGNEDGRPYIRSRHCGNLRLKDTAEER